MRVFSTMLLAGLATVGVAAAAAPARADYYDWRRHEYWEHERAREQAWREHEWRERAWHRHVWLEEHRPYGYWR